MDVNNMAQEKKEELEKALEKVPEFIKAIKQAKKEKDCVIIFHQDAFGADYQTKELYLLGAVIKYAGYHGVEVRIIGKNRETLK